MTAGGRRPGVTVSAETAVLAAGGAAAAVCGAVAVVAGPGAAIVLALALIGACAVVARGWEDYLILAAVTVLLPDTPDGFGFLMLWLTITGVVIGSLRIESAPAVGSASKWVLGLYLALIAVFAVAIVRADIDAPDTGFGVLLRILVIPVFLLALIRILRARGPERARNALVLVSVGSSLLFVFLTIQAGNLATAISFSNVEQTKGTLFPGLEDNVNTYAFSLMIGLPALVGWYLATRERRQMYLLAAGGLVTAFALLIASSRSAILGAVVGVAFVLLLLIGSTWRRAGLILVATGAALWFLIPAASDLTYQSSNFTGRTQTWSVARDLWGQSPLLGHGPGSWEALTTAQARIVPDGGSAHNLYLTTLVNGGAIGLIVLLAMVGVVLAVAVTGTRRLIRAARVPDAAVAAGAAGSIVAVLARGVFESSGLTDPRSWLPLLTATAIAAVVVSFERSLAAAPHPAPRDRAALGAVRPSAALAGEVWPSPRRRAGSRARRLTAPRRRIADGRRATGGAPPPQPPPDPPGAPEIAATTAAPPPTEHDDGLDAAERSRAGRGAILQTGGRAVALSLNLITFAVMLRELGVVGFGYVTIALAVVGIIGIVLVSGIDELLFRELSIDPSSAPLTEALTLRLGLTLAIVPAYVLAVLVIPISSDLRMALLGGAAILAVSPIAALVPILRSQVILVPIAIMDVVSSAFVLGAVLLLSVGGLTPAGALIAMALGNVLQYGIVGYLGLRRIPIRRSSLRPGFVRRIASDAKYVLGGNLVVFGYFRVDVLILGAFATTAAVGGYGAAHRLVDVALYLPMIIVGAYFPGIARLWGRRTQLQGYLDWVSDRLILMAGVVAAGGILFGEAVLRALGGEQYGGLGVIVALLMTALAVMFINLLLLEILLAGRALRVRLLGYIAAMASTLFVGLPLIIAFGAEGAAVGKLVTEVVLVIVTAWAVHSRTGWLPPLLPSALAVGGALAAVAIAMATDDLVLRILGAAVLAAIGVAVMGSRLRRPVGVVGAAA